MESFVVALGYFDALHIGHAKIIEQTKTIAYKKGALPAVFTFDGDLAEFLGKPSGQVFTQEERKVKLKALGIDKIIYAPLTKEFLSLSKKEFLEWLNANYNVVGYVCGDDFTFGKNAQGKTFDLISYAKNKNQSVTIVDEISINKKRVSTTAIKEYLKNGFISDANAMLGDFYSVSGKVIKGRGDGRTIKTPTVNLAFDDKKFMPKEGVYGGYTIIDGSRFYCLINYGTAPTFSFDKKMLEAFVLDFNGDLYGKELVICFTDFIREIQMFSSKEELREQIKKDIDYYDKIRTKW